MRSAADEVQAHGSWSLQYRLLTWPTQHHAMTRRLYSSYSHQIGAQVPVASWLGCCIACCLAALTCVWDETSVSSCDCIPSLLLPLLLRPLLWHSRPGSKHKIAHASCASSCCFAASPPCDDPAWDRLDTPPNDEVALCGVNRQPEITALE
jgi:hypothetical protein